MFGKSAGNAVWLDADMTSPYQFYQYWIQTDDRDVERWLKTFTFLPLDEIAEIAAAHMEAPYKRAGQKRLAAEVTRVVHGEEGLAAAERATAVLFGAEIDGLSDKELGSIFADVPSTSLERSRLDAGIGLVELLAETMCKSKGEARRLLKGGGAYINNRRIEDNEMTVSTEHLASETTLVLRSGKKKYHVVRFA